MSQNLSSAAAVIGALGVKSLHARSFCFFASADFLQNELLKKSFRNPIRVSSNFDPDRIRCSVGPYLGPNCLQRLSADHKSRQKGKIFYIISFSLLVKGIIKPFKSVFLKKKIHQTTKACKITQHGKSVSE